MLASVGTLEPSHSDQRLAHLRNPIDLGGKATEKGHWAGDKAEVGRAVEGRPDMATINGTICICQRFVRGPGTGDKTCVLNGTRENAETVARLTNRTTYKAGLENVTLEPDVTLRGFDGSFQRWRRGHLKIESCHLGFTNQNVAVHQTTLLVISNESHRLVQGRWNSQGDGGNSVHPFCNHPAGVSTVGAVGRSPEATLDHDFSIH